MPARPWLLPLPLALSAALAWAGPGDDGAGSRLASVEWNGRLRHEAVVDGAFALDARATTLRLRAGLRFGRDDGFSALLEGEGIASAGDAHDSGANRGAGRPGVLDPEGAGLNQAWVAWKSPALAATAGRQRLLFANQRWIGNSGWRQDEQTFDALAFD